MPRGAIREQTARRPLDAAATASDRATWRRAAVVAAVPSVLVLALWDLWRITERGSASASVADHAAMAVVAFGAGSLVLVPLVFLRFEIARAVAGRARRLAFAAGVLDGAVLGVFWVNKELRRGIAMSELLGIVAAGALALGVARVLCANRPRLALAAGLCAFLGALAVSELLPWKGLYQTRLGFDLLAASALAYVLFRARPVSSRAAARAALALAACAVVATEPLLGASSGTRLLLHHRSSHARSWVAPVLGVADLDGDGAVNVLGGHDCDESRSDVGPAVSEVAGDGVDQNCEGGDGAGERGAVPGEPAGTARDADVLVISIDALRWDLLDAVPRIREALGPHARMERAVSPGSRTIDALSAVLRGRAVRGLHLAPGPVSSQRLPIEDPHPTLASLLTGAGYRAIMVPTHRYLDAPLGIFQGFEVLEPEGFALVRDAPYGIGRPRPIVRAEAGLARLAEGARETERSVLAWIHLMETHDPYHWGDRHGPGTIEGLRRAVEHLDPIVAGAIESWRAERGRPTVVAILGDHGEEFHEHGGRYHATTAYAEQARVVMLLSGPGVPAERVQAPVSTASLAATVVDLAGLDRPESFTEPSLLPCLRDPRTCPELAVTEIRTDERISVGYTTEGWRLVYDPVNRVEELFDSEADPLETTNLATERPDVLTDLRAAARRWDETH